MVGRPCQVLLRLAAASLCPLTVGGCAAAGHLSALLPRIPVSAWPRLAGWRTVHWGTPQDWHPVRRTPERIKTAKKLKLALTAGIGSDHVNLHAAAEAGITVAEITGVQSSEPSRSLLSGIMPQAHSPARHCTSSSSSCCSSCKAGPGARLLTPVQAPTSSAWQSTWSCRSWHSCATTSPPTTWWAHGPPPGLLAGWLAWALRMRHQDACVGRHHVCRACRSRTEAGTSRPLPTSAPPDVPCTARAADTADQSSPPFWQLIQVCVAQRLRSGGQGGGHRGRRPHRPPRAAAPQGARALCCRAGSTTSVHVGTPRLYTALADSSRAVQAFDLKEMLCAPSPRLVCRPLPLLRCRRPDSHAVGAATRTTSPSPTARRRTSAAATWRTWATWSGARCHLLQCGWGQASGVEPQQQPPALPCCALALCSPCPAAGA